MLTRDAVQRFAASRGFPFDGSEKVLRLLGILRRLAGHEATEGAWLLKGGTALNIFHLGLPRLSVDIDLNYTGALARERMLAGRPLFERGLEACCRLEGCEVRRVPGEHAGGKFRLRYESVAGGGRDLEVDVSYVARQPLLEPAPARMDWDEAGEPFDVPVLALEELAAGKFAALTSRGAARDYFDAASLLERHPTLSESPGFRLAFTCAAAGARADYLGHAGRVAALDLADVEQRLLPLLRSNDMSPRARALETKERLDAVVPAAAEAALSWRANEREFIRRLNAHGVIEPSLLSSDTQVQERIAKQPMLQWKRENVRRHLGLPDTPHDS